MANNLTTQVRNIADVTTAVASGDLTRKITVEARGEVAALAETINTMVDQLSSFADEVTRVAREVGTEGILGGQANVKGVERHVEGPDRLGERPLLVADDAGAQHRRRDDRGRERRPVEEDHRRRPRRGARAEGDDQRDGRPAPRVLVGGDARRARGRLRGHPRRPGPRRGRLGRVGGPDRQRELHGVEPDDAGAEHRRRDDRGRERRPDAQDHRRGLAARSPRSPRRSTRWSTSSRRSPTR